MRARKPPTTKRARLPNARSLPRDLSERTKRAENLINPAGADWIGLTRKRQVDLVHPSRESGRMTEMRKYRSRKAIAEDMARAAAELVVPEHAGSEAAAGQLRESIEKLAYQLWVKRGCPAGSAEEDWYEAERSLQRAAQTDRLNDVHVSLAGAVMRAGG